MANTQTTYRCQDCGCIFFTVRDLAKHKMAFGLTEGKAHADKVKRLHEGLERFGGGE